MFTVLQEYLTNKTDLSPEEIETIKKVSKIKKLRRKQYLLHEGEVWKHLAFVCSGLLKTYFIDDSGREHIISFSQVDYWTGDRESLIYGNPSKFNIDAIEDSIVILITKEDYESLSIQIPKFNQLINSLLQKSFIVAQNRILSSISLSAEEKYHNFLEKYPSISNRIPQHMIASFIGITSETITRIRRITLEK